MYAMYAYIDPSNHPNVGIYGIHGVALRIKDPQTHRVWFGSGPLRETVEKVRPLPWRARTDS